MFRDAAGVAGGLSNHRDGIETHTELQVSRKRLTSQVWREVYVMYGTWPSQ